MFLRQPIRAVVIVHSFLIIIALVLGFLMTGKHWVFHVTVFFSGIVGFSLAEYLIHRFILHSPAVMRLIGRTNISHLVHHDRPRDINRLDLDLIPSLVLVGVFLLIFWLGLGGPGLIAFAGFLTGYVCYELVHYLVHFNKPPLNFLKYLWAQHAYHHYVDETLAYGVTTPVWDFVFGTLPDWKRHNHGTA